MTEIEETLSRVLTAEADRHEPPVFDAYRIAGAATAKRRRWRPALFAVVAAVIGTGGVGGATVFATGGGHSRPDLRPRPQPQPVPHPAPVSQAVVTFQSPPGTASTQGTDDWVLSWVHMRTEAEGLKDVKATVEHNPWRLEVTGHVADLDRLKLLDMRGTLQFRPVAARLTPPSMFHVYHQTEMTTLELARSSHGQTGTVQVIRFTFDDAEGKVFAVFAAENAGKPVEVLIDGAPTAMLFPQTIAESGFEFTTGTSLNQIHALTESLADPVPASLQDATVTVSTR